MKRCVRPAAFGAQPRWPVAAPRRRRRSILHRPLPPAAASEQPRYVPSDEPRMLAPPPERTAAGSGRYAPPPRRPARPCRSVRRASIRKPARHRSIVSAASGARCAAWRLSAGPVQGRADEPDDDEDDDRRVQTRPAASAPSYNRPLPALGPQRGAARHRLGDAGRGQAGGDAGLSDRLGARSMDRQRGAAGGAQVVRPAGGRDQADLGLLLPRHERPGRRAHLRARVRQRARHRRLRAGRRQAHHHQGQLERLAGGAGLPARRAGARPATSSPPCWRRAPTSSTTTTSTST